LQRVLKLSQKSTKINYIEYDDEMSWYKIRFRLEDFGHNNAQLISKNYLTYTFFTPTQVDYALARKEDLITHREYIEEKPKSTPAITDNPQTIQRLYAIRGAALTQEMFFDKRYPTYGKIVYINPGSIFKTYSQILPRSSIIFIGKKRRVARILSIEKVETKEEPWKLTSYDLITKKDFEKLNLEEFKIEAISRRWVFGRFKVEKALKIGEDYFISPLLGEKNDNSI